MACCARDCLDINNVETMMMSRDLFKRNQFENNENNPFYPVVCKQNESNAVIQ